MLSLFPETPSTIITSGFSQWVNAGFGGHFVTQLKVCFISDFVKGVRAIRGFDKNEFGKVILMGPGSRACHVLLNIVYFN